MIERVAAMLARCGDPASTILPPTELYNEGWMLRLVLDCLDRLRPEGRPIRLGEGARWYSEALLASQFLPRHRGDPQGEGYTHADAAVGHFDISPGERGEVRLRDRATQFVIIEAKLGSKLSAGTSNAPAFDQAARNVACMAHVIAQAERSLDDFSDLAFYVAAPEPQILAGDFGDLVTKPSIYEKVRARVAEYEGSKDRWFEDVFQPTLDRINVGIVSWESLLAELPEGLRDFYDRCLAFNLRGRASLIP